jgi:5'-3' exonuclease
MQILMGDKADNIIGINGIGMVRAENMLIECTSEQEMFDVCVKAYDDSVDRVIENARLLWLRREEGQIWEPPKQV